MKVIYARGSGDDQFTIAQYEGDSYLAFGNDAQAIKRYLPEARAAADYVIVVAHAGAVCDSSVGGGDMAVCHGEIIDLARQLDIPRPEFKLLVRKLKALGLTESYPIGYELSELGMQYLDYAMDLETTFAEGAVNTSTG
mgnify:CR=1 FL=1